MPSECGEDVFDGSYFTRAIVNGFCILFITTILFHSIFHIHKQCHWKKPMAIMTVSMQTVSFIYLVTECLKTTVGSFLDWAQNDLFCGYIWIAQILKYISFLLMLNIMLYKLKMSFVDSIYELSKTSFNILFSMINIAVICGVTLYFSFAPVCLRTWIPYDLNVQHQLSYCVTSHNIAYAFYFLLFVLLCIIVFNIVFGISFSLKLKKILKNGGKDYEIQYVMIKNTIITLSASISTLITWLVWGFGGWDNLYFMLYIDLVWNCAMISLYFKHNDKYFRKGCTSCIKCCVSDQQLLSKYINAENASTTVNNDTTASVQPKIELK
eukprot:21718_1